MRITGGEVGFRNSVSLKENSELVVTGGGSGQIGEVPKSSGNTALAVIGVTSESGGVHGVANWLWKTEGNEHP